MGLFALCSEAECTESAEYCDRRFWTLILCVAIRTFYKKHCVAHWVYVQAEYIYTKDKINID